ncbi:hypothetical protein KX729_09250 [Rhizobium sp. XQZ8]|uniref:hypothetical protein n=1 Tax=Rhizobium populisoli TaxID=2859785 RepID=UPI001CA536F4|nr:hypothetical protein [Rhizobium populisoli]MBW6421625.1 hypothetical protein [Rhizobium populisoli]
MTDRIFPFLLGWIVSAMFTMVSFGLGTGFAIGGNYAGRVIEPDWAVLLIGLVAGFIMTLLFFMSARYRTGLPVFTVHVVGIFAAAGISFAISEHALGQSASRYNLLTENCYYVNVPVYNLIAGKLIQINDYKLLVRSSQIVSMRQNLSGSKEVQTIPQ